MRVPHGVGSAKPVRQRPGIYAFRKSDRSIVVKNPVSKVLTNKVPHGGVGGSKGSNDKKWRSLPDLTATQGAAAGSSGLERLHIRAKAQRKEWFTNLFHHLTPRLLVEAYKSISRKSYVYTKLRAQPLAQFRTLTQSRSAAISTTKLVRLPKLRVVFAAPVAISTMFWVASTWLMAPTLNILYTIPRTIFLLRPIRKMKLGRRPMPLMSKVTVSPSFEVKGRSCKHATSTIRSAEGY